MQKKTFVILILLCLFCIFLSSCDEDKEYHLPKDTTTEVDSDMVVVTFKNYNDEALYSVRIKKGSSATYGGDEPTRKDNDEISYTFIGWDKPLDNITESITVYAQYDEKPKGDWGPIYWESVDSDEEL